MIVIKGLTIISSFIIFTLVVELTRKEKLTFKYAFGWMFVSILAILLTVFDNILFRVSNFFGFELTSNFVFFILLGVFVFLSLFMTVLLCEQDRRNDTMAQKIGILEYEIRQMKDKNKNG